MAARLPQPRVMIRADVRACSAAAKGAASCTRLRGASVCTQGRRAGDSLASVCTHKRTHSTARNTPRYPSQCIGSELTLVSSLEPDQQTSTAGVTRASSAWEAVAPTRTGTDLAKTASARLRMRMSMWGGACQCRYLLWAGPVMKHVTPRDTVKPSFTDVRASCGQAGGRICNGAGWSVAVSIPGATGKRKDDSHLFACHKRCHSGAR